MYYISFIWFFFFSFFKLESLEIWNRVGEDFEFSLCQGTLKQLLMRSPLNYLLLRRIPNLTDDLLIEVLKANPLLNLSTVFVDYCHNVTGRFFWLLLEQPNTLSGKKFHPKIGLLNSNIVRRLPWLYASSVKKPLLHLKYQGYPS